MRVCKSPTFFARLPLPDSGGVLAAHQTRSRPQTPAASRCCAGRGGQPVVIVGNADPAALLQKELPTDVPLWWLKLDEFHTLPQTIGPIPEISAAFADELLRALPAGTPTLIGYSFGGLIAFDLAGRLQQAGRRVNLMLLEPSTPPTTAEEYDAVLQELSRPSAETPAGRVRRHLAALQDRTFSKQIAYLLEWTRDKLCLLRSRLLRFVCYWVRIPYRLRAALACKLSRRLPLSLRLKIRLRALLSDHQDMLKDILWRRYGHQAMARVRSYQPSSCGGPVFLAGGVPWLDACAAAWRPLVKGEVVPCPAPLRRIISILSRFRRRRPGLIGSENGAPGRTRKPAPIPWTPARSPRGPRSRRRPLQARPPPDFHCPTARSKWFGKGLCNLMIVFSNYGWLGETGRVAPAAREKARPCDGTGFAPFSSPCVVRRGSCLLPTRGGGSDYNLWGE